jgi:hypothetical protein
VTIPGFGGTLLRPDENGYDAARAVWNAMHDRRPALIARPLADQHPATWRDLADDTAAAAYGRTIERLQRVKAIYDPENTFRLNQNITPAASGPEPATMP